MTKQDDRKFRGKLRTQILERDGYKCVSCGRGVSDGAKLEVDHVVAWEDGGKTVLSNGQTLCADCNKGKHWAKPSSGINIVNKRQLCDVFGVSQQAVDQWHKEGVPILAKGAKGKPNTYDTSAVYRWALERYKISNLSELDIEDTRLKRAKANRAELEFKRMSGELLPVDVILQTMQSSIIAARNKLLSVKNDIKIQYPDMKPGVLDVLDKKIRETLDDLSGASAPRTLFKAVDRYYADLETDDDDEGERVGG